MIGQVSTVAISGVLQYYPIGCLATRHNDIGDVQLNEHVESAPEPCSYWATDTRRARYWEHLTYQAR